MQLKRAALLTMVLSVSGVHVASTQPVRCVPGPATMAAVSTHVFLGTPLEVTLQKGDDMYYLRVKWRVDEALATRTSTTPMAVGTEVWVEASCIDLEPEANTAAYSQGYCPNGRGIIMRGAVEDPQSPGVYTALSQSVAYMGSASVSVLDQKRVWSDVSNVPFTQCDDTQAVSLEAEIDALKKIEIRTPQPVPVRPPPQEQPAVPPPKSGCAR